MNEELGYAEMLEIPVETVTVNRKERRKRAREEDLSEKVVETVNDRVEKDPAYAESTPVEREVVPADPRARRTKRLLVGEFIAVCALCATIFLTNIFMADSAINTFVRGLFQGTASAADTRTYSDFALSPVVNEYEGVEIAVSETGVMSFTAACSVYAPCEGELASVTGDAESGYTLELKHSDTFSTVIGGLSAVYAAVGDEVRTNVPLAYSDGSKEVRVTFYEDGAPLNCYTLGEDGLAWS